MVAHDAYVRLVSEQIRIRDLAPELPRFERCRRSRL